MVNINYSAYDHLSEKEIQNRINRLGILGYHLGKGVVSEPIILIDGQRRFRFLKPISSEVHLRDQAASKYGVTHIKFPAQTVIDYFQENGNRQGLEDFQRNNLHITHKDLGLMLDLICLEISSDKKIMQAEEKETRKIVHLVF